MAGHRKNLRVLLIVSSIALFLALLPLWPYRYYTLLRFLVCATAGYGVFIARDHALLKKHLIPLAAIAIVFNPFLPIHLNRALWFPIDLAAAVYFIMLIRGVNSV